MATTLSFHGAAGTVTGSRFLLQSGAARVLVDCGLFQGLKELRLRNWAPPRFDPGAVSHVLLTHAHIDHSGALPRLFRLGLRAPVLATHGTSDLAELMLIDSASLQEEDAEFANRKGYSKHAPALPLYTVEDARRVLRLFRPVRYGEWIPLGEGLRARFRNAGHMLGSGSVEVAIAAGGRERTLVFSGDVGRYGAPLHPDPEPPPACDWLVVESTYGDRVHDAAPLGDQIVRTFAPALARGGTVLIPAFAVGRAQLVTLVLRELMEAGRLAEVPIHIDSPMAVDATTIYNRHLEDRNLDPGLGSPARGGLFPRNVRLHRSVAESKWLNDQKGPRIILSSSGMLTGGRVLHHFAHLAGDERNLIALVGYQAAGTRGRRLLDGEPSLRCHGCDVGVKAEVVSLGGFSGHADRDELMRWIGSGPGRPREVFVVHGEPAAAEALRRRLEGELGVTARTPRMDEAVVLE